MNTVSIYGIGKLGLCVALIFEKKGYNVIGVDNNTDYVNLINSKKFISFEPQVNNYLNTATNIMATTDVQYGYENSDIIFIYVSTPSLANSRYDHSQIDNIIEQLIDCSKRQNKRKHLIIGCTTMPGYCDEAQKKLDSFGFIVSYCPEFIAQGSIIHGLLNPDILLIGEGNDSAGDVLIKLYANIFQNKPSIHRMSPKEAEISKIALNCYLTTKISYANMIGDIAISAGCKPEIILNALGADSRIGVEYLTYGFGFGGPCLPRDNRALASYAMDLGIKALISLASNEANVLHLKFQLDEYKKNHDKNEPIIITDVAYKPGTNIIEESQQLALASLLADNGFKITINNSHEVIEIIRSIFADKFEYSLSD